MNDVKKVFYDSMSKEDRVSTFIVKCIELQEFANYMKDEDVEILKRVVKQIESDDIKILKDAVKQMEEGADNV